MKLPVSWMREFVDVAAGTADVASRLASCGFAVDGIEGDVIDFDVTANRPDCLSVYGLAREASTAFDVPLKPIKAGDAGLAFGAQGAAVPVTIEDPACGRYALALADVSIGTSPEWLTARLLAAGVRPINNVVDVTNYVMIEMGHPMHAFDLAKLAGPEILVRKARKGEPLTTLDGASRTLDESMLVIADRDRAVAVAGVMGGATSEVSSSTARIALESAWFLPGSVRATSKQLGLKTEASTRFERGADLAAPVRAIQRALALLVEVGASKAAGALVDVFPRRLTIPQVPLRRTRVERLLGQSVPDADIERILGRLGFGFSAAADGWTVEPPSFRIDVTREADLIEEVGRHWGFDRIPPRLPAASIPPPPPAPGVVRDARLRSLARSAGLQEAVTFTFIERAAAEPFVEPGGAPVAIANPLSEKFAVLRPSLLPGLLDALVYNRRREAETVRFFELGSAFSAAGETTRIGWVLTGPRAAHWDGAPPALDFFDAKGVAELLTGALGIPPDDLQAIAEDGLPWFVRGRAARLVRSDDTPAGRAIGHVGQIRPDLVAARGLDSGAVVAGEIDLGLLDPTSARSRETAPHVTPLPRFPSIVRDLSFFVEDRLPAAELRGTIRSNAPSTLVAVREFDRYQGKGVPDGQVSLSLRLTFRDAARTLTDVEVQRAVDEIVGAVTRRHGAVLRQRS